MIHRRLFILTSLLVIVASSLPFGAVSASGPEGSACLSDPFGPGCTAGLPSVAYQMLLDEMLLHPEPDVRPLAPNSQEIARFAFRRIVGGTATIYDAPGGNAVGSIDEGFNYVTVTGQQGDWIQINDGQWMPASQLAIARPSEFTGVYLDGELAYPMAWVLVPNYPSPNPGAAGDQARPILERYTRVNIFATVELDGWEWYLVGPEAVGQADQRGARAVCRAPARGQGPLVRHQPVRAGDDRV